MMQFYGIRCIQYYMHDFAVKDALPVLLISNYIKTHGSESRGQEEAGLHDKRVSYLQVAPL